MLPEPGRGYDFVRPMRRQGAGRSTAVPRNQHGRHGIFALRLTAVLYWNLWLNVSLVNLRVTSMGRHCRPLTLRCATQEPSADGHPLGGLAQPLDGHLNVS